MVYSDTTNKNGLLQMCEFYTGLGDAGISGNATLKAQFTQLLNARYHEAVGIVLLSQDEWDFDDPAHANTSNFPKTYNLSANTANVDIDVKTNKILRVDRVEITYDGSNWYKAEPIDLGEMSVPQNQTDINNTFSQSEPFYDMVGDSVFLYPIPTAAVTGGLKVFFTREIDEFVVGDTTQEPALDEPFHKYLPLGASIDWLVSAQSDSPKIPLYQKDLDRTAQLMRQYYGTKNQDRHYVLKPANPNEYNEDY